MPYLALPFAELSHGCGAMRRAGADPPATIRSAPPRQPAVGSLQPPSPPCALTRRHQRRHPSRHPQLHPVRFLRPRVSLRSDWASLSAAATSAAARKTTRALRSCKASCKVRPPRLAPRRSVLALSLQSRWVGWPWHCSCSSPATALGSSALSAPRRSRSRRRHPRQIQRSRVRPMHLQTCQRRRHRSKRSKRTLRTSSRRRLNAETRDTAGHTHTHVRCTDHCLLAG